MLLGDAVGDDQLADRVTIYASDIDGTALAKARRATYTAVEVADVPRNLRDRWFEAVGSNYVVRPELRRSVQFRRNNLIEDRSPSRLDVVVCRNTLVYLNADARQTILERFHRALNAGGILFLGSAETVTMASGSFAPIDRRHRLWAKRPDEEPADLRSTNDELAVTNAQLLSANEALASANETLQCMNDELRMINGRLRRRLVSQPRSSARVGARPTGSVSR